MRPLQTPARRSAAETRRVAPARTNAEARALDELETWRLAALPDVTTPLDAGDLVRLLRDCVAALQLEAGVFAGVSVNTVHYYRRKDIIDPPIGKTASARYDVRHLWQVAGARLAGQLGLVTLAEARAVIRGANEQTSREFLASRVADARARAVLRAPAVARRPARDMRPLPGAANAATPAPCTTATVVTLPGNAWCVIPANHIALQSPRGADALVRALAHALETAKHS
jgi:DNA-binding transcriptional MerR regulator